MRYEVRTNSIEVYRRSSNPFPYHLHTHIEILVCTQGTLHTSCNNQEQILHKNDIMICFPNEIHSYVKTENGEGIMIIFNPNISDVILSTLNNGTYSNFIHNEKVLPLAQKLLEAFNCSDNYSIIFGYLHIIFGMCLRRTKQNKPFVSFSAFDNAIRYISDNYTKLITLEKVSKKVGVSQAHLSRVFSERIDGGFKNYLNILRVEKAKKMLEFTDLKICELMFESGFGDQRTFNRVFKNTTGMTPVEYRKSLKSDK